MLGKALLSASVSASAPGVYVEDVFSTYLYTGNGGLNAIANGIDLAGEGGLVWIKSRGSSQNHVLTDTLRGDATYLSSNTTAANTSGGGIYLGDGFAAIGSSALTNASGDTYASWTFRKAPKFFDVATYTGNGTTQNIAHNLGSAPGCIIVKQTNGARDWPVYHRGIDATNPSHYKIPLNKTEARANEANIWNDTEPTSTHFTVGSDGETGGDGNTYVAYLFAHDAGGFGDAGTDNVISCGSYTGNGSADGPEIDLGWEPQWVMFRRVTGVEDWIMFDNMRGMVVGGIDPDLRPNQSQAEGAFVNYLEPNATGFKLTDANSRTNENGDTYIYIAIRRGPMRAPTSGTEVFSANTYSGGTAGRSFSLGFVPDALLTMRRNTSNFGILQSRLTSGYMFTYDTGAESVASTGIPVWDADTGTLKLKTASSVTGWNASGSDYVNEVFRRAPGFFDVVAYTGTGSARTVAHNLGVAPEMMIVKSRSDERAWRVYTSFVGNTGSLRLNSDATADSGNTGYWNNTTPTDASFTLGIDNDTNSSGQTYIAYLFATLAGISKVGSYTGTGTTLNVDCGFTAGARFVLIKRTDSTGDWYVWDTARGIVSGDDPYLLLNSDAAEVTNTDYIDPLSSGFQISSTAPAAINASGGSFIFLAIA
jgi:hypothetical protein